MMGMTQTRTMVASVAGLVVVGVLAGCTVTGPNPIDRTRHAGEVTEEVAESEPDYPKEDGNSAGNLSVESGTLGEKGIESSALADAVSDDGEDDARAVAEEGELLGEGLDVKVDAGAFASDCLGEMDSDDEEPCSCILSFRGDVVSATFPWPNDGTTDSMLPAVVAVSDGRALAIEMAVTYETSLLHQTNEFHNEATRLGDEVRRETVRLVRSGVTKRGKLEDALSGILTSDSSQVTGVDVYNIYEVEPIMSPEGYVAYVPVMGTTE